MSSNNELFLYPVAPPDVLQTQYETLLERVKSGDPVEDLAQTTNPTFTYSADLATSAGRKVPRSHLEQMRENLRNECNGKKVDASSDARLATFFFDGLRLHPAQAEDGQMWATLAAFVFPDYVVERFPGLAKDRVKAGRRNALARLWFRRLILPAEAEARYALLGDQDSVQQIVERPHLSTDNRMIELLLEITDEVSSRSTNQREFFREFIKQATYLEEISMTSVMPREKLKEQLFKRAEIVLKQLSSGK